MKLIRILSKILKIEEENGLFFSTSIQKYQYLRLLKWIEECEVKIAGRQLDDEGMIYYEEYKRYVVWVKENKVVNYTIVINRMVSAIRITKKIQKHIRYSQMFLLYIQRMVITDEDYNDDYQKLVKEIQKYESII